MNRFFILASLFFLAIPFLAAQGGQFEDDSFMPAFQPASDQFPLSVDESDEPDSGNWYEKLHWWKEAKRVYTVDIHDSMEQLKQIAQEYEEKKKTILAKAQQSVASLPVTAQVAEPLIASHLTDLKAQREKLMNDRMQDQGTAIAEIEDNEKILEMLKTDFENLTTLGSNLNEAIVTVFGKQIKESENYEERALEYFERIEKVLDDKKAHHYYDIVENSLENIRAIIQYLIGPLQIFIDDTAARVEVLVPKIKKSIEDLEKKDWLFVFLLNRKKPNKRRLLKKGRSSFEIRSCKKGS